MDDQANWVDSQKRELKENLKRVVKLLPSAGQINLAFDAFYHSCMVLTNYLIDDKETIILCFNKLHYYGIKLNDITHNQSDPNFFTMFVQITCEYLAFCNFQLRQSFIDDLIDSISNLSDSVSQNEYKYRIPSLENNYKEVNLKGQEIKDTLMYEINILAGILRRLFKTSDAIVPLASKILTNCDDEIRICVLEMLEDYVPVNIHLSFIEVRAIMKFYFEIINNCEGKSIEIFDKSLSKCYYNALTRVPQDIIIILGRETFNMISVIKHNTFKIFNEKLLSTVYKFIQADKTSAALIKQIVIDKLSIFYDSQIYIKICQQFIQYDHEFAKLLVEKHGLNPKIIAALIKIDIPGYYPDQQVVLSASGSDFYDICSCLKNLDPNYITKLREIIITDPPNLDQLKLIARHIPLEIVEHPKKYQISDLPYIFSECPDILESLVHTWMRYKKDPKGIPFLCMLVDKAKKISDLDYDNMKDYFNEISDDASLFTIPQFVDVIDIIFERANLISKFEKFIKTVKLYEIEPKIADGLLKSRIVGPLFLKMIIKDFTPDQRSSDDSNSRAYRDAFAVSTLSRNSSYLWNVFDLNRYEISYQLLNLCLAETKSSTGNVLVSYIDNDTRSDNEYDSLSIPESYRFRFACKELIQIRKISYQKALTIIEDSVIPVLVQKQQEKILRNYIQAITSQSDEQSFMNKVEDQMPNIFTYIFSNLDKPEQGLAVKFVKDLLHRNGSELMKECFADFMCKLLLNLGDFNPQVVAKTKNGISLVFTLEHRDENLTIEKIIQKLWNSNEIKMKYGFAKYITNGSSSKRIIAIRALTYIVNCLRTTINTEQCRNLLTMVGFATRDVLARPYCYNFLESILELLHGNPILADIFSFIVAQIIPNIEQSPAETKMILIKLIKEEYQIVQDCLFQIALLPEIKQIPELTQYMEVSIMRYETVDLIDKLAKALTDAPPDLQVLIIIQLIDIFKSHIDEDLKSKYHNTYELGLSVWKILTNTPRDDLMSACGRLLAILSPVELINNPPISRTADSSTAVDDVMINIITEYLVPAYEDFNNFSILDSISCTIQILLKELGCSLPSSSQKKAQANMQKPENWDKFDSKVQMIIDKYRSSTYIPVDVRPVKSPVFNPSIKHENWLANFTICLLQTEIHEEIPQRTYSTVRSKRSKLEQENTTEPNGHRMQAIQSIKKICFILKKVPSICNYILPLISYWQRYNPSFKQIFSAEFATILDHLKRNPKDNEVARQCMHTFFAVFDACELLKVWPSVDIFGRPESLEVASNQALYEAAYIVGLYTHALVHLELAIREEWHDGNRELSDERLIQMKKVYKHLKEPDALTVLKMKTNTMTFMDDFQIFTEAKIINPAKNSENSHKMTVTYLTNLLKCGRTERALTDALHDRNTMHNDRKLDAVIARAATRLSRWDVLTFLSDHDNVYDSKSDDHASAIKNTIDIDIAYALSYLDKSQYNRFNSIIDKMRLELASPTQQEGTISFDRMMPCLINYLLIEELSLYGQMLQENKQTTGTMKLLKSVDQRLISIDDIERITVVNCAMIELAYRGASKQELLVKNNKIMNQLISFASACRKSGEITRSQFACWRGFQIDKCPTSTIEIAKITWMLGNTRQAMSLLVHDENASPAEIGLMTYLNAKWNAELEHLPPDKLMEEYKQAVQQMEHKGKGYYAMASLADERIEHFLDYFEKQHLYAASHSKKISKFTSQTNIPDFLRSNMTLALECYMKCISNMPELSPEVVPRILQIYFDLGKLLLGKEKTMTNYTKDSFADVPLAFKKINSDPNCKSVFNDIKRVFNQYLENVDPAIWLNSLTQLLSRVEQPSELESTLFELIKIAVKHYPQQGMWYLMSVKNSENKARREKYQLIVQTFDSKLKELAQKFENVTTHLINLAQEKTGSAKTTTKVFSADKLCRDLKDSFKNCDMLMPLSSTMILDPSSKLSHSSRPTIVSMGDEITIFKSLQKPKKISLNSNEGRTYHFMCKLDEDLRKDMRMMEFATFINRVFGRDRRSRERNLSIVTFIVVCLSEKSGLIEWVEYTCSFRSIIDKLKAASNIAGLDQQTLLKYYCDEKGKLTDAVINEKRENFVKYVLPAYPPVLHKWFLHNFPSPQGWFKSRLLFARSAAVWSMVGYILGIGDRHTENILLNQKTGGVVHVDFNCMFDKAKLLPCPEIVPFRLTQNMVDGFGVLGTDGSFTESSVIALTAMRDKKKKLLTLLQPFISDPLVEWKDNEAKVALVEIDSRLSGLTQDKSRSQSPLCVVKNLISEATDYKNLALMYIGWTPHI